MPPSSACSLPLRRPAARTIHVPKASPRRAEAEAFIARVFAERYGARITAFALDLMLLERAGQVRAAAGWRGAGQQCLFLENYLDQPAEALISRAAGHPVARDRVVEVGHLAAARPGGGSDMILALADQLHGLGYEWVIFTATRELIGIFTKLGLPPLALASADPARLGAAAAEWGRYYDTRPIVVAGRIRQALDMVGRRP